LKKIGRIEKKFANKILNFGSYSDDNGQICSEAWALRKVDEDLLSVFQRNHLQIVLGIRLTDNI